MEQKTYFILGRQPALGLAELEALFGAPFVRKVLPNVAEVALGVEKEVFNRIGGSIKMARLLSVHGGTDWQKVVMPLVKNAPTHAGYVPEGKLTIGLSVYGLRAHVRDINTVGIQIKKAIRTADPNRPIRIVPNKEPALSSPQVIHNDLTGSHGWELVFIRDGNTTIMAQTIAEQDIEGYAARDQARPARDAKVGMLPPKLAQIIINLAATNAEQASVLDPFCGTGVVLQEALLMGYNAYGTDLEPRMIAYSDKNLEWLRSKSKRQLGKSATEVGDASKHQWRTLYSHVAGETYLGRPMIKLPAPDELQRIIKEVSDLHYKFLKNIASQTPSGTRFCIAVPAWFTPRGFLHLSTLEKLGVLGYNRVEFVHVKASDLIYHRSDQIVGRELVILTRK